MKITNQTQLDDLIATANEYNTIVLMEDLEITFDCEIPCNLKAHNIVAHNIDALNIDAYNIDARNIDAHNLYALNIGAHNIDVRNLNAHNIDVHNLYALNIDARKIYADNIKYYAFCIAYESLKCKSISGKRNNSLHKCLDREIEIIEDEKIQIELTKAQLDKIKHLIN
jgi:hypothetical protein